MVTTRQTSSADTSPVGIDSFDYPLPETLSMCEAREVACPIAPFFQKFECVAVSSFEDCSRVGVPSR